MCEAFGGNFLDPSSFETPRKRAAPQDDGFSYAYHLIIYRFRPIFAAGAQKACIGR
jgi:hypothetical protein